MQKREAGFTLVELMTTFFVISLLSALGFWAFRHYWLARALDGSRNQVVTQLRELQQQAQSESHPAVYGARFRVGFDSYTVVRYLPPGTGTGSGSCSPQETVEFEDGVRVADASFSSAPGITAQCASQVGGGNYVFFFARGSATAGSITLMHNSIDDRRRGLTVAAVTGRVEEVD